MQLGLHLPEDLQCGSRAVWLERETPSGWARMDARISADGRRIEAQIDRLGEFQLRWEPAAAPPVRSLALRLGPDPFRTQLGLRYVLPRDGAVRLAIFDLTGRRIRLLAEGMQRAGVHTRVWDGRDQSGRRLGSGVYFARLQLDDQRVARRCLLVR
ncbi:MAG: hypothetical protein GF330_06790 [Candidatus Eisenbacteria bacterium]|nr:hypothetical protein [Candidatus Eisenbacteria bacterium]